MLGRGRTTPVGSDGRDGFVFLSYAAEDRDLAAAIAASLESRGWSVWWDRHIPLGQPFDEVIEDVLQRAGCVVVLWTKTAVASRWVRSEASVAAQRDVLLPLLMEEATLPLEFRLYQALDLKGWKPSDGAAPLESLHDAVEQMIGRPPSAIGVDDDSSHEHSATSWSPYALIGLALLIAVAAAGGWYWDAFYREIHEHYANVTKRWGLPEGVGPLTADRVTRRNASILLVRRGRRHPAHEVRVVTSAGLTPPAGLGNPIASMSQLNPLPSGGWNDPQSSELAQLTRVTFSVDSLGRVLEQSGFNRGGRRLYTLHFAESGLAEYKQQGFGVAVRESGIRYLRFSTVPEGPHAGLDESVQYLDDRRQPQPDEDGTYGYRLVLDESGRVVERVNRGLDGTDHVNNHGVLKEVQSFDTLGNILEATTVSASGRPTASRLGPAAVRFQYDESGNATTVSWIGEEGQPVVSEALRAASAGFTYDQSGKLTSLTFFGPDQAMVVGQSGFARQTIEWQTPTRFLARFYGAKGRPIPAVGGAFEALISLESRGLPVEYRYRDVDGTPTRSPEGCATVRSEHDDVGNIISSTCLDEQSAPTISIDGSSSIRFAYDEFGNRRKLSFYDRLGAPGVLCDTYSVVSRAFTASGLIQTETYMDDRDTPVRNRSGFASVTYTYDAGGNPLLTTYADEAGRRTTVVDGYSAIRRTFDERRLEIETAYLDGSDRPTVGPEGYATLRYERDQRGFITRLALFDPEGRPTRGSIGYCSARIKYNEAGSRLEMTFFDEGGAPTLNARSGSARRRWTYDDSGRVAKRSDHGANGRAIMNAYGYSVLRYQYDEHGREAGRQLLDTQGRPLEAVVVVDRVGRMSMASEAGLRVGDIILAYDGLPVKTSHQFTNTLERSRGDRRRELRIERGMQVVSLDVPPGRLDGLELAERAYRGRAVPRS